MSLAGITWYEILGVLPSASADRLRREYDARRSVLRPELISGAPSNVVVAVRRAEGILDKAWRVLGDPVSRERYDNAAGIRRRGGGLDRSGGVPSDPGVMWPDWGQAGDPGTEVIAGLMMLADWLTPRPRPPARIPVPDLRGLFYDVCLEIAGRARLPVTAVRLTEHPMPVPGLVVDQSPRAPARARRASGITVQVWHPPARARW